jgi:hypothetical protein
MSARQCEHCGGAGKIVTCDRCHCPIGSAVVEFRLAAYQEQGVRTVPVGTFCPDCEKLIREFLQGGKP